MPEGEAAGAEGLERFREVLQRGEGRIHFVGIGGVGMAGVARHAAHRGLAVSGSDAAASRITDWLEGYGIRVYIGHDASHVARDVRCVVRTPAVGDDNPELLAARSCGIPVIARGAALPILMEGRRSIAVAGTHGKTSTAAMIAHLLADAGRDPAYCVGGEIEALDGVAGVGGGDFMVVEADESDGTLCHYTPDIGVITNIEFDHMEHFTSRDAFLDCFRSFFRQVTDTAVFCAEDATAWSMGAGLADALSYGFREGCALRGRVVERRPLASVFSFRFRSGPWLRATLPAPGDHNVLNALGAAAAAHAAGVSAEAIRDGFARFRPARRRFEVVDCGLDVQVVSDYAHHPTEIAAVVRTARGLNARRILAVYQPHRYTRTRALCHAFPPAFEGVDELILVPVYAASESPIPGGASEDLLEAFKAQGGEIAVRLAPSLAAAWSWVRGALRPGDLFLVLGAGDVEKIAAWAADAVY